jgi:hypothetical protein
VCGDIRDKLRMVDRQSQVDGAEVFCSEEDLEEAVVCGWAQGDGFGGEGLGDLQWVALEADVAALLDLSQLVVGCVRERIDIGPIGPGA